MIRFAGSAWLFFCAALVLAEPTQAEELPLLVAEDFESDLSRWQTSDPESERSTWLLTESESAPSPTHVLRAQGGSKYRPPHRSPLNLALLKEPVVSDFELRLSLQNTNYDAGAHRDLCIFWGYQDPAHFYYVHLGAKPDPHSCQVFIVNDADRTAITRRKSPGTPWDRSWHQARVTHDTQSGNVAVYFDDLDQPAMTAVDRTFTWGRVGVGTFDDHGNFDDVQLRGVRLDTIPDAARLPSD